ncbi:unnamed protein product [Albugo candida]|uniref:Uncharacterized protein n=1 Tax=Albugo candida TaxID=65357 RepID=A0A024G1Z6_9STRA|nr:unnamed protein product [Albugo candida]|eukprot:CCI40576.1 unnamed protein product [Albugo candida]
MFRLRGIYKLNVLVTSYQTVDWNLSDGKRSRSCVQLVHHRVYGSNVMNYMHPAWLSTGHADDGPRSSQGTGAVKDQLRSQMLLFKFTASDETNTEDQRKRKRNFAPEPILSKAAAKRGRITRSRGWFFDKICSRRETKATMRSERWQSENKLRGERDGIRYRSERRREEEENACMGLFRFVKDQMDSLEAVMGFLIEWKDTSYMHVN